MKLIYIAMLALGAFVAIWMFFVVPAERKHHDRKLEALRKQIEKRAASKEEDQNYTDPHAGAAAADNDNAKQA